jgi:hypothetical protein
MTQFLTPDPETIREVLDELDNNNEQYRLIMDQSLNQPDMHWFTESFPFVKWGLGRISWAEVPSSTCLNWSSYPEQLSQLFEEISIHEGLQDTVVTVIWITSSRPILETTLAVVRKHAAVIFDADLDTWVVCRSDGWCVEVYHEGEICFGRVPPRS